MKSKSDARQITKAVIPVAGKGTRLLPLTKAVPKELIPLGKKPVLEHIMDEIAAAGIRNVLFVISKEKIAIKKHFGRFWGNISIDYTLQAEQKGLADAIYCAKDFVANDPFSVVLGDSVIDTDQSVLPFTRVLDTYKMTSAMGVIVVQKTPRDEVGRYGIVRPKDKIAPSFEIDGLVEKPDPKDAPSDYAIAGRYAFDPIIFYYIDKTPRGAGGEYQITDSIELMLRDKNEVWCVALRENEVRRDIGTFESYFEAFDIYKKK